jgi:hypothetical protein
MTDGSWTKRIHAHTATKRSIFSKSVINLMSFYFCVLPSFLKIAVNKYIHPTVILYIARTRGTTTLVTLVI